MHLLHLTFLYCIAGFFYADTALESSLPSQAKILKSTADSVKTDDVEPLATNIILQSKDGGQSWEDISHGLPETEKPEGFFAGESEIYLRVKNQMYRSKRNLNMPVWEEEIVLDPRCTEIAFNRSGVLAYNHEGKIYQEMPSLGTWVPVYTSFKSQSLEIIFETSDGTILVGCRNGLYKSTDRGQTWKHVVTQGWVMDLVESEGVIIGTSQKGIMRSNDNGEHWEWVISEGGVGIDVERVDGGFVAIAANTSTMSRQIYMSLDHGKTWKAIDEGLPRSLSISSIKQMGKYLICGHPDGIFRSSDMGKTWNVVHPNVRFTANFSIDNGFQLYDGKVFKIYVSGNVLYAVASSSGC